MVLSKWFLGSRFDHNCSMLLIYEQVPEIKLNFKHFSKPEIGFNFYYHLTSKFIIRWHSSTKRFVPSIFILTDSSNFSSNFTVAAEWNTTDTLRHNIVWSHSDIPRWSCVMSPQIGITLLRSFGFSFRIVSNNYYFRKETKNDS